MCADDFLAANSAFRLWLVAAHVIDEPRRILAADEHLEFGA